MKKKSILSMGFVSLFSLGLAAQSQPAQAANKDIEVIASFYPMYEFTKQVVGDEGNVSLLIKAGTEAHDFEPSTKDIARLQKADAFVYDDDNMETWVPKVKKSLDNKGDNFIKATGDMLLMGGGGHDHEDEYEEEEHDHEHGEKHEHDHDEEGHSHEFDPHVWLSPERSQVLVTNIANDLSKKFPEKADAFKKNAEAYNKKLSDLDKKYDEALKNAKQKSFVTQHAAFGYLALDYGLNQVPITGVSAEAEPSAKRLGQLSKYVKKYDINYIYFEENASSKVSKTLASEAGVKTAVLNPLEGLTTKQMKKGENYITVMEKNLKALRKTTDKAGKAIEPEKGVEKTVYNGYFKDSQIKDRKLSDWTGKWQSVYPLLQDGTLDQVFDYKAKKNPEMSAAEYKDYYTTGYKTDIEQINIDGKKMTMAFVQNGKSHKYTYKYAGRKTLNYEKGNRGVRFMFETDDKDAGQFKYVQFSDHDIRPNKAEHFHIYFGGESQDALLKELEHWPTYYPSNLSGHEVAQEMLAH
ncbi:zinc ABC transporter substrate-binding protein AdcA [Streptococcus thoraltensis]|uniref:zinc ABC transporter substrate-binding protein AdcA n=1 Tax=Streptococcus thoraltensis TaxID=55085 RepID=UPI001F5A6EC3|nr:zinc ABC transporter substrate-binding protein AdcA [Streptococcus thoraltensis]